MKTVGDQRLDVALNRVGDKGLFTKELEQALLDHAVDLVVHSLKDLPTTLPDGLRICAIAERASPYDAVLLHPRHRRSGLPALADLPPGSTVGTSSLRRVAQLRRAWPHLQFADVRGNLNTRLRKLDEGDQYDALVLAEAGLVRMGWAERVDQVLADSDCLYAVGQGALAVECRAQDERVAALTACLHDPPTAMRCEAERAFMRHLEGGCHVPMGASTQLRDGRLHMRGAVFSLDGSQHAEGAVAVDRSTRRTRGPRGRRWPPTSLPRAAGDSRRVLC